MEEVICIKYAVPATYSINNTILLIIRLEKMRKTIGPGCQKKKKKKKVN